MSVQTVKKNKIIGLTGGIATGKTTVTNYLEKKGYYVIDSDKIVEELFLKEDVIHALLKYGVIKDNKVERKKLSYLIFNDSKKRKEINEILHPKVFARIDELILEYKEDKPIFIDMPLLIETEYYKKVDSVLVVYANKDIQVKRLMKRNLLNEADAVNRLNAQLSIEEKKKYAHTVFDNTKTLDELYKTIDIYLENI